MIMVLAFMRVAGHATKRYSGFSASLIRRWDAGALLITPSPADAALRNMNRMINCALSAEV